MNRRGVGGRGDSATPTASAAASAPSAAQPARTRRARLRQNAAAQSLHRRCVPANDSQSAHTRRPHPVQQPAAGSAG
jgi:hypothetical protein